MKDGGTRCEVLLQFLQSIPVCLISEPITLPSTSPSPLCLHVQNTFQSPTVRVPELSTLWSRKLQVLLHFGDSLSVALMTLSSFTITPIPYFPFGITALLITILCHAMTFWKKINSCRFTTVIKHALTNTTHVFSWMLFCHWFTVKFLL